MAKRKVAFYCHTSLMADHLYPIFKIIESEFSELTSISILFNEKRASSADLVYMERLFGTPPIKSKSLLEKFKRYDDLFVADHITSSILNRSKNIIHVGHGHASKIVVSETNGMPYEYDHHIYDKNGRLKYSWMFESSDYVKEKIVELKPELANKIIVLGSGSDDIFLSQKVDIKTAKPMIVLLSTHGPQSALEYLIDDIENSFSEINKTYNIILDLHPLCEKNNSDAFERALKLTKRGAIIKPTKKNYYSNADYIISDHTSMIQKVALVNNRIMMIPIDHKFLWQTGATKMISDNSTLYDKKNSFLQNIHQCKPMEIDPSFINSNPGNFSLNFSNWYNNIIS